jgi:hypothetical protein
MLSSSRQRFEHQCVGGLTAVARPAGPAELVLEVLLLDQHLAHPLHALTAHADAGCELVIAWNTDPGLVIQVSDCEHDGETRAVFRSGVAGDLQQPSHLLRGVRFPAALLASLLDGAPLGHPGRSMNFSRARLAGAWGNAAASSLALWRCSRAAPAW